MGQALDSAVLASVPHFIARLVFTACGNEAAAILTKEITAHAYLLWSSGVLSSITRGTLDASFFMLDTIGLDHSWKQAIHGVVDTSISCYMMSSLSIWNLAGRAVGAAAGSFLTQKFADKIGLEELPSFFHCTGYSK